MRCSYILRVLQLRENLETTEAKTCSPIHSDVSFASCVTRSCQPFWGEFHSHRIMEFQSWKGHTSGHTPGSVQDYLKIKLPAWEHCLKASWTLSGLVPSGLSRNKVLMEGRFNKMTAEILANQDDGTEGSSIGSLFCCVILGNDRGGIEVQQDG